MVGCLHSASYVGRVSSASTCQSTGKVLRIVSDDPEKQAVPAKRRFEDLAPAAQRALKEAEERRAKAQDVDRPKELGGRDGPEPTRFGDWEKAGIISDF